MNIRAKKIKKWGNSYCCWEIYCCRIRVRKFIDRKKISKAKTKKIGNIYFFAKKLAFQYEIFREKNDYDKPVPEYHTKRFFQNWANKEKSNKDIKEKVFLKTGEGLSLALNKSNVISRFSWNIS